MASPSSHEKLCEPCQQKKKKVKVRSFCFECQELLCKECSDIHLTFKISRNHNLIDLIPLTKNSIKADSDKERRNFTEDNAENSSDFVDDELSSDFLDHMTLTKDTILYGAQVAVERSEASSSDSLSSTIDPKHIKLNKIVDFNTLRDDDTAKLPITGVISMSYVIVVATSDKLKLFDQNGGYLSSKVLREVNYIYAIALIRENTFVVGGGSRVQECNYDGGIHEGKMMDVGHTCDAICFNGNFYGVLYRYKKIITVLDSGGTKVRTFSVSDVNGKEVKPCYGIQMDRTTNDIYMPCQQEGVLCKSITGETLWFKSFPATYTLLGITQLNDVLCVAHSTKCSVELVSKNGDYLGALLKDNDMRCPEYLHFCERTKKLYVTFGRIKADLKVIGQISIFTIENELNSE